MHVDFICPGRRRHELYLFSAPCRLREPMQFTQQFTDAFLENFTSFLCEDGPPSVGCLLSSEEHKKSVSSVIDCRDFHPTWQVLHAVLVGHSAAQRCVASCFALQWFALIHRGDKSTANNAFLQSLPRVHPGRCSYEHHTAATHRPLFISGA